MATDGQQHAMSIERLAELVESFHECERLYDETNSYGKMNYGDVGFHRAKAIIPALLAEVERLRAREAALREHLQLILEDAEMFHWRSEWLEQARALVASADEVGSSHEER